MRRFLVEFWVGFLCLAVLWGVAVYFGLGAVVLLILIVGAWALGGAAIALWETRHYGRRDR